GIDAWACHTSFELLGDPSIVGRPDAAAHVRSDVGVVRRRFCDVHVVTHVVAEKAVAEVLVKETNNLERIPGAELEPTGQDPGASQTGIKRVACLLYGLEECDQRLEAERRRFDRNEKVIARG